MAKDNTNWVIIFGVIALSAILLTAITQQSYSIWVWPFVLMFATIFGSILALCIQNIREDRYRDSVQHKHPDQPWMWDMRWQTKTLPSRSLPDFWGCLAVTVILGVFAMIGVATLLEGLPQGNLWVLLNLIPIIAATYFLHRTFGAYQSMRVAKLVSLTAQTRPAVLGQRFTATISAQPDQCIDSCFAWLEHIKIIRHKEHDGDSFEKRVDTKLDARTSDTGDGGILITVDLPETGHATSWSDTPPSRWWDLVIDATVSGQKASLRYEIPVTDPAKA